MKPDESVEHLFRFFFSQSENPPPTVRAIRAFGRRAILILALFILAACSTAPPEGASPVTGFELDRYLGKWHEVARLDHRFERGLVAVTAEYALRDDGGVAVTNRGYDTEKGEWSVAEGKAFFTGAEDTGSLKVSFFGPFYGGYHILALDEAAPDYRYALVVGPNTDYLWVLARDPDLPEADIERLLALADELGFPVDELIRVDPMPPAGTAMD